MQEKIVLLVVGLVFGIVSTLMAYKLRRRSWEEETRHALHQSRFDEGTVILDDLSELIGRRFFLLQRLWWAIEREDDQATKRHQKPYFEVVEEWNAKYWRNRNKIRLLVGDEQASYFLDYKDDLSGDKPRSLHYKFVVTHRKVMAASEGNGNYEDVSQCVDELNWKCSVFLERLTTVFVKRATTLQLLETPKGPGAAEQAAPLDS